MLHDSAMTLDISILTPDDAFTPGPTWVTGQDWADGSTSPEEHFTDRKHPRTLAPNLTRRSHKKSRNGCFSCKTRKIKCDETKPVCTQCKLKSVDCHYPSHQPRRDTVSSSRVRLPTQPFAASPAVAQFSLNDMQFFHHFLTISFPHLPLGNDDVWIRDIPQFAQEHTYLMHAILALGASHLNRMTPHQTYEKEALMHRGHAITGLNTTMAKSQHAYGEADAMLATCYALTFQSSYMPDGLSDFVIFVRGCALATGKIRDEQAPTAFNLAPDRHHQVIRPRLHRLPPLSTVHILSGLDAIDHTQQYLTYPAELSFYHSIRAVLHSLQTSSASGYLTFMNLYRVWYELSHEEFKVFLDTSNTTIQILLGFFIGLQMLMAPLTAHQWPDRADTAGKQSLLGIADWMGSVANKVPEELQWHLEWAKGIVQIVVAEVTNMPYEGAPVIYIEGKGKLSEGVEMGRVNSTDLLEGDSLL